MFTEVRTLDFTIVSVKAMFVKRKLLVGMNFRG